MSDLISYNSIILFIVFFFGWKYLESIGKKNCDRHWDTIRIKGKRYFIIIYYILLRGLFVTGMAFIIGLKIASLSSLLLCVALPLLVIMISVGGDEWRRREMDFIVESVKNRSQNKA